MEYVEVHIPFFHRGPILSHTLSASSGSAFVAQSRRALVWRPGRTFKSRGQDVSLTGVVQFGPPEPLQDVYGECTKPPRTPGAASASGAALPLRAADWAAAPPALTARRRPRLAPSADAGSGMLRGPATAARAVSSARGGHGGTGWDAGREAEDGGGAGMLGDDDASVSERTPGEHGAWDEGDAVYSEGSSSDSGSDGSSSARDTRGRAHRHRASVAGTTAVTGASATGEGSGGGGGGGGGGGLLSWITGTDSGAAGRPMTGAQPAAAAAAPPTSSTDSGFLAGLLRVQAAGTASAGGTGRARGAKFPRTRLEEAGDPFLVGQNCYAKVRALCAACSVLGCAAPLPLIPSPGVLLHP